MSPKDSCFRDLVLRLELFGDEGPEGIFGHPEGDPQALALPFFFASCLP